MRGLESSIDGGDSLDMAMGSSVSRVSSSSKSSSPSRKSNGSSISSGSKSSSPSRKSNGSGISSATKDAFSIKEEDMSPNTKWKNDMAELVVEEEDDNQSIDFETSAELEETNVMYGSVSMANKYNKDKKTSKTVPENEAKKTPKKALKSSNGFNMDNRSNDETDNSKNQLIADLQKQIINLKAEKASIESGFQIELERHKQMQMSISKNVRIYGRKLII